MTTPPTTISALPTTCAHLAQALAARRAVHVTYHRLTRLLCPHALSWRAGRAIVLGYHTGGQTSSATLDPNPHKWRRQLYVDEIDDITTADAGWSTADNHNAQRPFPTIDELHTAVTDEHPTQR
jgi:hypothetical protein